MHQSASSNNKPITKRYEVGRGRTSEKIPMIEPGILSYKYKFTQYPSAVTRLLLQPRLFIWISDYISAKDSVNYLLIKLNPEWFIFFISLMIIGEQKLKTAETF